MSLVAQSVWAAAPTATRGQPTPLSSDPKGDNVAYASKTSIFVRSIDEPRISKQYTAHVAETTVARFSPSGYYVASGDKSGIVRVWDCVGEGLTKGEHKIISGQINDLAWDGDSQRIIAVGNGKDRYGRCIMADSGNSIGEISGHSTQINCVSIRQQRPLRAVTGSDDTNLVFYHGVPFKMNKTIRAQHENFVFSTEFSSDGANFASVGSDRKIWLYDGTTGDAKKQIGKGVHTGSIFGISWSKDSSRIVTCSADQTVKIWDVEAGKAIQSWRMGDEGTRNFSHQQVGVVWPSGRSDGMVISVDVEGNINYLVEGTSSPRMVLRGHQKSITTAAMQKNTFTTSSYDGRVCSWDVTSGTADRVRGILHAGPIIGMVPVDDETICSAGLDDTLRSASIVKKTFGDTVSKLGSQPKGIATILDTGSGNAHVLVATMDSIVIFLNEQKIGEMPLKFMPTVIAAQDGVVVVGADDGIRIYFMKEGSFCASTKVYKATAKPVSALKISPNGKYLAAGMSNGKILLYAMADLSIVTDRWGAHTGRINCLEWTSDSECVASSSLDSSICVWSVAKPVQQIKTQSAHKDGVNVVAWAKDIDESGPDTLLSCGGDAAVKTWKVIS